MGLVGTSKDLPPLLNDSTEFFPASSDTYRRRVESPQSNSGSQVYSRFVLMNVLAEDSVPGLAAGERGGLGRGKIPGDRWRENARQPVSRVLSALAGRDDHSSGTHLAMRLTRPTRAAGRERPCNYHRLLDRDVTAAPIRSCSRWGLPCRPCCQGRGALLPHRFALARGTRPACAGRSCTGGLFSVALSLGSPPPAVSRHRVPVEPGLSSTNRIAPFAAVVQLSGGLGFAPARSGGQAFRERPLA
jgi:hypothetical protein